MPAPKFDKSCERAAKILFGMKKNSDGFYGTAGKFYYVELDRRDRKVYPDDPEWDADRWAFERSNFGVEVDPEKGEFGVICDGYIRWAEYGSKSVRRFGHYFVCDGYGIVRQYKLGYSYGSGATKGASAIDETKTSLVWERSVPTAGAIDFMESRNVIEAAKKRAREEEYENASAIPKAGRQMIEGKVVSLKEKYGQYGFVLKMLVQHVDGWKVWGTVPKALLGAVERGDTVVFEGSVSISDNDSKFGFYSRPSKAKIVRKVKKEEAA